MQGSSPGFFQIQKLQKVQSMVATWSTHTEETESGALWPSTPIDGPPSPACPRGQPRAWGLPPHQPSEDGGTLTGSSFGTSTPQQSRQDCFSDAHSPPKLKPATQSRPRPALARKQRDRAVTAADSVGQNNSSGDVAKGAIAQLQEFVQGSRECRVPASCPILQWSFNTRMSPHLESLEFRAKA